MTPKERVMGAIRHIEPDKIPKGELQIDDSLADRLLGISTQGEAQNALIKWMTEPISEETFRRQYKVRQLLNMDIVDVFPQGPVTPLGKTPEGYEIIRNVWGVETVVMGNSSKDVKSPIADIRTASSYKFPSLQDFKFDNIEKWAHETDLFVTSQVFSAFDGVWWQLLGFENYMTCTYMHKEELKSLIKEYIEFEVELAKAAVSHGADAIIVGDDLGYNSGTFLSPASLREIVFPYMEKQVTEIKKIGIPVVLHSCGNINQILDDIVNIGFDALHAMQPSAHMDLAYIKQRYGDKLCLWGNLDVDTLSRESGERVDALVREAIRVVAPNGGYILSSSNMLSDSIPAEIALTMYRAAEEYGKYPISLG